MPTLFKNTANNSAKNEALTKELLAISTPVELYNRLVNDDYASLVALESPQLINMLTSEPFYEDDQFNPPINGIAKSRDSLFSKLCRYNLEYAIKVLTTPNLSTLLHKMDVMQFFYTEQGAPLKTALFDRGLAYKVDDRFQESLHESLNAGLGSCC